MREQAVGRFTPDGWLCLFGVGYIGMHVGPTLFKSYGWYGLATGDFLGLFAPLVVVPLAWLVHLSLRAVPERVPSWQSTTVVVLFVASILYVSGHGINFAANAIARYLTDIGTPVYRLTYFLDEHLGHLLWHAGVLGIAVSFLLSADGVAMTRPRWTILIGPPCFAFAYATDAIEGQTVLLLLPGAAVVGSWAVLSAKEATGGVTRNPVRIFLVGAFLLALVLFAVWGVWQGGFPEFSEVWNI